MTHDDRTTERLSGDYPDAMLATGADDESRKRLERGQAIALAHFEHVERQVQLAATKASLIVAADALMLNAYVKVVTDYEVFLNLGKFPSTLFAAGGVLLIIGLVTALLAVFPKTWASYNDGSVLFYGWIARSREQDYIDKFSAQSRAGKLDEDLLHQIHAKSCWLKKMFLLTSISITAIIVGAFLCVSVLACQGTKLPGLGKHKEQAVGTPISRPTTVIP